VLVLTHLAIGDRPALAAALVASALVAVICLRLSRDPTRFTLAIAAVVVAGLVVRKARTGILLEERNFFGVREVRDDARAHTHVLMHGTTKHGAQSTDPLRRREPLSYHNRQGPLGDVFRALPSQTGRRVAVIGLGTGAMAAYAGAGEQWVFYEIDPDIARLARDARYFTYLQDTPASVQIVLGDGRLSLAQAPNHYYDLIFIDAFSSDAIPTHLLTLEALSIYRSKLSEKGVLVLHLSNRYLDLEPVVGRLVEAAGIAGLIRANTGRTRELLESGGDPSIWAAVASRASLLGALREDKRWRLLRVREKVALWTDDFSNIFSVFRWP
jgi:SAM-dependent methyltransferase